MFSYLWNTMNESLQDATERLQDASERFLGTSPNLYDDIEEMHLYDVPMATAPATFRSFSRAKVREEPPVVAPLKMAKPTTTTTTAPIKEEIKDIYLNKNDLKKMNHVVQPSRPFGASFPSRTTHRASPFPSLNRYKANTGSGHAYATHLQRQERLKQQEEEQQKKLRELQQKLQEQQQKQPWRTVSKKHETAAPPKAAKTRLFDTNVSATMNTSGLSPMDTTATATQTVTFASVDAPPHVASMVSKNLPRRSILKKRTSSAPVVAMNVSPKQKELQFTRVEVDASRKAHKRLGCIVFQPMPTWQGRIGTASSATCTVNSFLAAAWHLSTQKDGLPNVEVLCQIIDQVAPPMAKAIRQHFNGNNPQLCAADAFLFQDQVLEYLGVHGGLARHLEELFPAQGPQQMAAPKLMGIFHGNIMGGTGLDDFIKQFASANGPAKRSATVFWRQHVISIHRGITSEGKAEYQVVDTLHHDRYNGSVMVWCADEDALQVTLQKYAHATYLGEKSMADWEQDELSFEQGYSAGSDFSKHPLLFEAYMYEPAVPSTPPPPPAVSAAPEPPRQRKSYGLRSRDQGLAQQRAQHGVADTGRTAPPPDTRRMDREWVHCRDGSQAWLSIPLERRLAGWTPADANRYNEELAQVLREKPDLLNSDTYWKPCEWRRKAEDDGDEISSGPRHPKKRSRLN